MSQYDPRETISRQIMGVCTRCNRNDAAEGKSQCEDCLAKYRERYKAEAPRKLAEAKESRDRLAAQGRCKCGKLVKEGRKSCAYHLRLNSLNVQRHKSKQPPKVRLAGHCRCGKLATPGRATCGPCRLKNREYQRRYRGYRGRGSAANLEKLVFNA